MLSPNADTIMIPMMGSLVLAVMLLPVVCGTTWFCLRGNHRLINLLAWDRKRPIQSASVTLFFAIPFCVVLWSFLEALITPEGWYDHLWLPHTLVTLVWLALMRGAALTTRPAG